MTAFVNGGITDTAKKSNLDSKYGPYESVHAAYTALTSPTDYVVVGLTVGIQTNDGIVEYWFQNGTNESDLVLKVPTVDVPVQSVNSKTGDVVLDNTDVGAAATVHTHTVSDITNFPSLATVATSGNYSDLNGTPTLATVATSGSYSDLTNKPTIPAAQVQTDWDAESGISSIANKPTLATVATSGSYADLSNKPEIPAAQIQSDWGQTDSSKKDFIKNKPTIPSAQVQSNWAETDQTAKSFIQNKPSLATVATTGAYSDLTGTPTIPAAQVQSDWNATSGMGEILNKPTLATVATTGSYNDLTNRPNIPAAQVQADWTESDTSSMAYIAHKPTIPAAQVQSDWNQTNTSAPDYIKNKPAIAGNVQSDWTENDSTDPSYIQHKPTLATVATSGSYTDLTNTPTIPAAQIQSDWNQTDTTALDYIKNKPNIVGQAQSDWTENDSSSPAYILHKPTLATVATSGSYNDLSNKPTIPAAQVQTDWNASSGMGVLLNKPTLATVATSGDYEDLSNTPTIPTSVTDLNDSEGLLYADADNFVEEGFYLDYRYGTDPETGDTLSTQLGIIPTTDADDNPAWELIRDGDTIMTVGGNAVEPRFPMGLICGPNDEISVSDSGEVAAKAYRSEYTSLDGEGGESYTFLDIVTATDNEATLSFGYEPSDGEGAGEDTILAAHFNEDGELVTELNGVVTFNGRFVILDEEGTEKFGADPWGFFFTNQCDIAHTELDENDNTLDTHVCTMLNNGELEVDMDWSDGTDSYNEPIFTTTIDTTSGDYTTEIFTDVVFNGSTSGIDYNDLSNKPTIPAAQVQTDWNASSGMGVLLNKPNLATVATSGSYNDLSNKPTIPAAQIQSDWNQSDSSALDFIKNKPTIPSISGCEVTSNKVTSLTAQSTDTQYPSAKCVYDIVGNIESALTTILGV